MGWTLNGVVFQYQGQVTDAHADGNNAAGEGDPQLGRAGLVVDRGKAGGELSGRARMFFEVIREELGILKA
jgi:hypothetical protein